MKCKKCNGKGYYIRWAFDWPICPVCKGTGKQKKTNRGDSLLTRGT
jgi:DnaJ-class molecular chaperone